MTEFTSETNKNGMPVALLREGDELVAKIYLSPDQKILRMVLPELVDAAQLKIDTAHRLIDFKRRA